MSKIWLPFLGEQKVRVTPSIAAPGDTNPSDATDLDPRAVLFHICQFTQCQCAQTHQITVLTVLFTF